MIYYVSSSFDALTQVLRNVCISPVELEYVPGPHATHALIFVLPETTNSTLDKVETIRYHKAIEFANQNISFHLVTTNMTPHHIQCRFPGSMLLPGGQKIKT
jgi:hypothetical protein